MSERTVGFVGLGHIGAPMAGRVAARFPVVGYDVRVDAASDLELPRAHDLTALARMVDIVLVSVPDGSASTAVVSALAAVGDRQATMVVDLSTIGPTAAAACARVAGQTGLSYLDAPVSGGRRAAVDGSLSIMMAGAPDDIARADAVVGTFARDRFVVGGEPGLAQAMKLVNNAIALAVVPVTSEALAFGERCGLDLAAMLEVINASSGRTQRSEGMFPTSVVTGAFDHGAVGEITRKDMALFVEEAGRTGLAPRIADLVAEVYGDFVRAHPATDYSYLHAFIAGSGRRTAPAARGGSEKNRWTTPDRESRDEV